MHDTNKAHLELVDQITQRALDLKKTAFQNKHSKQVICLTFPEHGKLAVQKIEFLPPSVVMFSGQSGGESTQIFQEISQLNFKMSLMSVQITSINDYL